MQCSRELSIQVITGIEFAWFESFLAFSGGGFASFSPVPDGALGNTGLAFVMLPSSNPGSAAQASFVGISTVNTTADIQCNMHINLTATTTPGDTALIWSIVVAGSGPDLVNENQTSLGINGSFDIPFTIPNTMGMDVVVSWSIFAEASYGSNENGGELQVEATFTEV